MGSLLTNRSSKSANKLIQLTSKSSDISTSQRRHEMGKIEINEFSKCRSKVDQRKNVNDQLEEFAEVESADPLCRLLDLICSSL